ncbi:MAG: hypothetical protein RL071_720 [Pseudomonadota bacterium]
MIDMHWRGLHLGGGDAPALAADAPAPGFATPEARASYAPDLALEPTHLELRVELDELRPRLQVEVVHHLRVRRAGARVIRLDGVQLEGLEVDCLDGAALRHSYDGEQVCVTFAEGLSPGATLRLRLRYAVESPLTGVLFSLAQRSDPAAPVFVATDHETERARHWLACVDHPSVRTTLDLRLVGPAHWTLIGNGAQVSDEAAADGKHEVRWRLEQPCPSYLICFVAGELVEAKDGEVDGVPIAYYAPAPIIDEDLWRTFGRTGAMLRWITRWLDRPYPYPKYFQFAVPTIGGAMENISLVSWDDSLVTDKRLGEEIGWIVDVVNLHEMAHTWFGDAVVCRDFAHSWLKEGWATYMESVWLGDTVDADAAQIHLFDARRTYVDECDGRYVRPIVTRRFDSSWDLFDAHLYPGAAWRLHMLRGILGEDTFWAAVRDYLRRYEHRFAETDDFRRVLEEHSGLSLAPFFDQWLHRAGYPKLEGTWTWDGDRRVGRLELRQTQVRPEAGVGLFQLDLTVAIQRSCGRWERLPLAVRGERATLEFSANFEPLQIIVDPDGAVLQVTDLKLGVEKWGRTLREGPSAWSRLEAAAALGRIGTKAAVAALRAAGADEPRWGVRRAIATALGAAGSVEAGRALVALLELEADPKVLAHLAEATGKIRHSVVVDGLMSWITGGAQPYRATAAALIALGKQRDPHTEALLLSVSYDSGWWGWVQRGAIQALGELRTPAAIARLQQATASPEVRRPGRLAAAEALGAAARWCELPERERVREQLEGLTLDADYGMRLAANRGLAALGDPAAAPAMRRSLRSFAAQDQPRVLKMAQGLRPAGAADAGLSRALEQLERKVRVLEDKLDRQHRPDTQA